MNDRNNNKKENAQVFVPHTALQAQTQTHHTHHLAVYGKQWALFRHRLIRLLRKHIVPSFL